MFLCWNLFAIKNEIIKANKIIHFLCFKVPLDLQYHDRTEYFMCLMPQVNILLLLVLLNFHMKIGVKGNSHLSTTT